MTLKMEHIMIIHSVYVHKHTQIKCMYLYAQTYTPINKNKSMI